MAAVETATSLYVKTDNRPGAFDRVVRALAARRINVAGVSVETLDGDAFVRMMVSRPDEALTALSEDGVEAYASDVVVVAVPNRAGQLARLTGELAADGINVEGVVTLADKRLAFRTSDNERAAMILRKA